MGNRHLKHRLTCDCHICRIRQAKGHRRPAVPATATPVVAGLGQQAAQSPFSSINPNIVNAQNQSNFSFNQTTTGNPLASQQGFGSFASSTTTNPTQESAATSQNTSLNFARPQTFSFSTPSSGFSFNAPSTQNPFSIANGSLNASTNGNGGFTGSIFNIPPSGTPAIGTTSQTPQASTNNIFSQSTTTNSQPSQTAQVSKPLFPGLTNNSTNGTSPAQTQQGNGVALQSAVMNGNIEDADVMMAASPDNSQMKQGLGYLSAGRLSPTRDASKQQTEPSEAAKPITTLFATSNTSQQQTGASEGLMSKATPSAASGTSEQRTAPSEAPKTMAAPSTTSSIIFGNSTQQKPMNTPQSGSNPFSAFNNPMNSTLPTKDTSQAPETSVAAPKIFTTFKPPTATNENVSLTGPVGSLAGPPRSTTAPSTGTTAVFTEAQQRHYQMLYQYLSLEASFKKQITNLPRGGDIDAITEDYWKKRAEIFGKGSSTGGLAGTKRKEIDDISPERGDESAKRSRVNGPEQPISHTLNHFATPASVTTGSTSGKRKAEDSLSKDDTADGVTSSKKARSEESVSHPTSKQSETSEIFTNILKKADEENSRLSPNASKEQSQTSSTVNTSEKVVAKEPSRPIFGFKPTVGVNGSGGSNTVATAPASPFVFKPTNGITSALKPAQLLPSTVNFMAQFSKSAQEAQEKEKAKRKAAEFDSEEENEEEWERRDAERQLAMRKEIEERAKAMVTKFVPGKGFMFVPREEQQSTEGNKDNVSQTSTTATGSNNASVLGAAKASAPFVSPFGTDTPSPFRTVATAPASPFVFKPTNGITSALKPAQLLPSTVNFMAQFSKSAQEAQEKEKAKRKAAEFDSEEENEEEWERRDAERQLAMRKEIEERAKAMVTKFVPGKGFMFVPREEQQSTEGNKDNVSQTSTTATGSNNASVLGAAKASAPFVSPFGTDTPSPSPPPNGGNSVFDQPSTFQQHKLQPNNIFAHLSDIDSGVDNISKAGDADDEGTETGEEDAGAEGQQEENVQLVDGEVIQDDEVEPSLDGDDASNEKAIDKADSSPNEQANNDTPKPASSGSSLFDRISRAEGDTRPLPTFSGDTASTQKTSHSPNTATNVFGQVFSAPKTSGPSGNATMFGQLSSASNTSQPTSITNNTFGQAVSASKASDSTTNTNMFAQLSSTPKTSQPTSAANNVFGQVFSAQKTSQSNSTTNNMFGQAFSAPKASESTNNTNMFGQLSSAPKTSQPASNPNMLGQSSSTPMNGKSPFNFNTSPSGDNTWKPNTPIKFGTTSTAPSFSFTAPTPLKAGQNEGKTPTTSPFLSVFSSGQPANPVLGSPGVNTTAGKATDVGFVFGGPPKAASTAFLAPSGGASNNTSRATSPGMTSDTGLESANDSNEGTEEKHAQIDLSGPGPGEEDEDVLLQVRAKAMMLESAQIGAKKEWKNKGVGPLRVLKHRDTGRVRVLMKQDPRGQIVLNTALLKRIEYKLKDEKTLSMATASEDGSLSSWIVRVGKSEDAKRLSSLLEEEKNSQSD